MRKFSRGGFTAVELLIFSAIFAIVSVAFLSVLVAVVRVQSRQGAATEVNQQSEFVMSAIQNVVARSSYIDGTAGSLGTSVTLRMPESAEDPTVIWLDNGRIAQSIAGGDPEYLTSSAVEVTGLEFVKRSNSGGRDVLAVNMTVSNGMSNPQRSFARVLNVVVSRVSAATFDSDLVPSASSTYKLGVSAQKWASVNELIYFGSSNVGIGATSPSQKLEVDGGLRLNTGTSRPTCDSAVRGTVWLVQNGGGTPDTISACLKVSTSSYSWTNL